MKKTCLFFFMIFLVSWSTFRAQELDYIIMMDNGSSINDDQYHKMKLGAVKLMEQLLACKPGHRVAVVQYGTGKYGETSSMNKPVIYIESDFTSDQFTAQNFERRLGFGDHLHESLGLVGDALDGNPNTDIISNQKTLNSSHPIRVIIFTDSERAAGGIDGSYLVNFNNTGYGSFDAFSKVMEFKYQRHARFTVVHANMNLSAIKAAAAIATHGGGTYSGQVEPILADPENTTVPRAYYNRPNGFGMYATEMSYWREIAQKICDNDGTLGFVDFVYEPNDCIYKPSDMGGHYNLPYGATLVDFKLDLVNLQTGDIYPVPFNPTFFNANTFRADFQLSDFDALVNAGATGYHKFRITMNYLDDNEAKTAYSWNNYPFFDHDIDMDCQPFYVAKSSQESKNMKLTPNPTNGLFKVILNKETRSGMLEIRDLVGNTVYKKMLRGEKEIEVDLSSRKEGVYIVNITTDKNEIYSEKVIKK